MKKILIFVMIISIASAVLCFSSCKTDERYQMLEEMTKLQYKQIVMEVSSKAEVELSAKFTSDFDGEKTTLNYTYDRVAKAELVDGVYVIPDTYIETLTGNATVKDGKIISQNGDAIDVELEKLSKAGFSFNALYFENASLGGDTFSADVINPKGFTGNASLRCMNMKVKIVFQADAEYVDKTESAIES